MKRNLIAALFFALILHISCSRHMTFSSGNPVPYPTPPSQLIAGVGQADLTPPPGYPMSGYSINGRISRGYWIKPKATALYIRDTGGTPFVMVTTDLWAITDSQKLLVLDSIRKNSKTNFIGENELLLAATHSHHSIGVNVPESAYSASSIGFGLDKQALEFTVGQIVAAIIMAVDSAKEATIFMAMDTVKGIAKNRSVDAYLRNNPVERTPYSAAPLSSDKVDMTQQEIESMIDPLLSVLVVKSTDGKIKGILASYAMHPTATGDATEVYSSDVFGLASVYASQYFKDQPIVAFYNGAEGDVAPDYLFHNRYDAVRIGRRLSDAVIRISQVSGQIPLSGRIIHRSGMVNISSNKVRYDALDVNCYCQLPEAYVSTATKAVVGASVFAGASDGRTSLSSFGINDGIRSEKWDPEQGHKIPAIKFLTNNVLGQVIPKPVRKAAPILIKTKPSRQLPISVHQVGNVFFVGLPGEFTTMLGRRIKKTIVNEFNSDEKNVSLVGLADSYTSYVTTPCEYNEQAYEGASNYFGISTGTVFVNEYKKLRQKSPDKMESRHERKMRCEVGSDVNFGPTHLGELQTWNAEEGLENLLVSSDGKKLRSHIVPSDVHTRDTILIEENEAAAYSFEDTVNAIDGNGKFYPDITLLTSTGDTIYIADYILTIDKYSPTYSKWTVRIPEIDWPCETPVQIIAGLLTNDFSYSALFRKKK